MSKTVLGIFTERTNAEDAITHLEKHGYQSKDISIMMKDQQESQAIAGSTGANSVTGSAASGATTGAVIGGLAGLLVGIGAITIPGVGAFLIGGPIAAALGLTGAAATTVTGATTGAVAGGMIGALVNIGVPEEDARVYETRINEGAILLAVPVVSEKEDDVRGILEESGAQQIKSVSLRRNEESSHSHTETSTSHTN